MRSSSISLLGDMVVATILDIMLITAADMLAHIKNTWRKDMKNKPKIKYYTAPLHGAFSGDTPPPPPLIMFA